MRLETGSSDALFDRWVQAYTCGCSPPSRATVANTTGVSSNHAVEQLTLDPADERLRRLQAVTDQLRGRVGRNAVRPAGAWL